MTISKNKKVKIKKNPKPNYSQELDSLRVVEEYPDARVMVGWIKNSKTMYVYGKLSLERSGKYLLANKDKESCAIFKEKDVKRVYYNKEQDSFAITLKE